MKYGFGSFPKRLFVISCLAALLIADPVSAAGSWQTQQGTGCKVWTVSPGKDTTFTWSGSCKEGYVEGAGTLQWFEDGTLSDSYVGQYLRGREQGEGAFSLKKTGANYEGEFVEGERSGKGTQTFSYGDSYEGCWSGDLPNGQGVQTWSKGASYEGNFVNGKMQGQGILTLKNGRTFSGRWENNNYLGP